MKLKERLKEINWGKVIIAILIIKITVEVVITPLIAAEAMIEGKKHNNGECLDVDVDEIIKENWTDKMNDMIQKDDGGFVWNYVTRPVLQIVKWTGDIKFSIFKWIYHTRSGC